MANKKLANLFTFRNKEKIDIEKMVLGGTKFLILRIFMLKSLALVNLLLKFMPIDQKYFNVPYVKTKLNVSLKNLDIIKDTDQCINHLKKI